MNKTFLALLVLLFVDLTLLSAPMANARTADQVMKVALDPIANAGDYELVSVTTTAANPLTDCTASTGTQRMSVANTSTGTDWVCWYDVAAGAACGTTHDCDKVAGTHGTPVLPGVTARMDLACSRRLCLRGSATVLAHVYREVK